MDTILALKFQYTFCNYCMYVKVVQIAFNEFVLEGHLWRKVHRAKHYDCIICVRSVHNVNMLRNHI